MSQCFLNQNNGEFQRLLSGISCERLVISYEVNWIGSKSWTVLQTIRNVCIMCIILQMCIIITLYWLTKVIYCGMERQQHKCPWLDSFNCNRTLFQPTNWSTELVFLLLLSATFVTYCRFSRHVHHLNVNVRKRNTVGSSLVSFVMHIMRHVTYSGDCPHIISMCNIIWVSAFALITIIIISFFIIFIFVGELHSFFPPFISLFSPKYYFNIF